jgi:Protein of Unknown function (DUF2784)
MGYDVQADLVLMLHLLYVGFVVLGQVVIVVGACLRWKWIRNPWFRGLHLLAMAIVVFEALVGITCPLTTWEKELRVLAGQNTGLLAGSERMPEINPVLWTLRKLLFPGRSAAFFIPIYITIFVLMLLTMVFAPPRRPRLGRRRPPEGNFDQSPIVS